MDVASSGRGDRVAKKRVLFIVGGRSGEHEISLISGKHVLQALDRTKYEPLLLLIQKSGEMTYAKEADLQALSNNPKQVKTPSGTPLSIRPYSSKNSMPSILVGSESYEFDLAFPILHGPGGEDGTIQGLFELAEIPVVGCGVKASSICMDKGMTKRLCQQAGLPVIPFVEVYRGEAMPKISWPFPLFVKPAHLGSSLGVSKVKSNAELKTALDEVFGMDTKALIEPEIVGRELEIAVLGKRGDLVVSPVGEIKPKTEFYSYDSKYVDDDGAELILPAQVSAARLATYQQTAKAIFETLDCHGMARVDFFADQSGEFLLNEVNTIPGFTPISMYPKLIGLTGVTYPDLVSRLIELASQR